jgi:hypothetical protein
LGPKKEDGRFLALLYLSKRSERKSSVGKRAEFAAYFFVFDIGLHKFP